MELFGIGPLELLFILIIALIVLGPRDMVKAGNTIGRLMRRTILSPTWMKVQREIRSLPYQMMREAGLEEADLRINTGLEEVDLRINTGLDEAFRANPNKITSVPEQSLAAQPTPSNENTIGQPQEVPNEWLGLPAPDVDQPNGSPSMEDQAQITEWTSAPETGVPAENQQEAKDAS
jgi:sec-independent protein translocase protein TatB